MTTDGEHCPFCIGGRFVYSEQTGKAKHTKPVCDKFKNAKDGVAFVAEATKLLRKEIK